jgi:hypothetical protein
MGSSDVSAIPFVANIEWASQILGQGFSKAIRQQPFFRIQKRFPGGPDFLFLLYRLSRIQVTGL